MAFERGFPAPEALLLDTEHSLLPGGDFIIMRRAPGSVGGDSFGGSERCSDELVRVLATALANLHNLPPLIELGDLTDSIRAELWSQPIGAVTRRYIQGMYDVYLRDVKSPLPALCALYGWLLSHVPEADGWPVLLHGDVGFHNMVLDKGTLSALVDWEFSHIGDPAEDVGYVQSVVGDSMDFNRFMLLYREAGGRCIDKDRLRFFHVWGKVRNATAASFSTNAFAVGRLNDLKLAHACPGHLPRYVADACRILESS
jgi:aminoglycoside phosphotransferase (APT) family kinase protein